MIFEFWTASLFCKFTRVKRYLQGSITSIPNSGIKELLYLAANAAEASVRRETTVPPPRTNPA